VARPLPTRESERAGPHLTSPRLNLVVGIRKNIKSKKVAKREKREKTSGIKMKEMSGDE
jgi:hypothetical protein